MDESRTEGQDDSPESPHRESEGLRLNAVQARVLGCLIEKESTTPDAYPLTLNATTTACNQKTSREPVMKLEPGRVGQALRELERMGLVRHDFSSRAERYRHTAEKGLSLTKAQLALVALLMLRGPQTVNELLTRSERIHRFEDADEVAYTLERLGQKSPPLVVRLPRQPGQREDRYMHLLCGPVDVDEPATAQRPEATEDSSSTDALVERIEALERRVKALEEGKPAED
ncbi:DUF480 domain-containing protein [Wenzhouxiangella sp. 15181]|nr:DUF480 domain-containing protein [Wenzhouxiangella sp. 15181]RFP67467.1 DUF480 domain-containing protein [Wenzhouxiangella sp. 15190]